MATAQIVPSPEHSRALLARAGASAAGGEAAAQRPGESAAQEDAAASDGLTAMERHPAWHTLSRLPVGLEAAIPLARFRVRDLVALRVGSVAETDWPATSDIPLLCGATQLSWAEFEVVDGELAVRLTLLG
ncbi:MAG: FliM/FliN family flagellar motor C-terminal domain-containing protein [Acidobacteriaceae bacterium]